MGSPNQKYKPRWYPVTVVFNVDLTGVVPVGAPGQGSTTIQNVPFILRRITAGNLGASNLVAPPPVSPFDSILPDQYAVSWRTDSHVYVADQAPIIAIFGSIFDWLENPSPVELSPKTIVTFDVTNLQIRSDVTTLGFVLHGVEPISGGDEVM